MHQAPICWAPWFSSSSHSVLGIRSCKGGGQTTRDRQRLAVAKRLGAKTAQYIKGVGAKTGQGHGRGQVGKSRQEEVRGQRAQGQGRAGRGSSEVGVPEH